MKDKEYEDKLDNINEKFTYAMQTFQTNLGNMTSKINEQSLLVSLKFPTVNKIFTPTVKYHLHRRPKIKSL